MKRRRRPNLDFWAWFAEQYIGEPTSVQFSPIRKGVAGVAFLDENGGRCITVSPTARHPIHTLAHEVGHHVHRHPMRTFAASKFHDDDYSAIDESIRAAVIESIERMEHEANSFAAHALGVLEQIPNFEDAFWID